MTTTTAKEIALKSVNRPASVCRKESFAEYDEEMLFLGESIEDTTYDAALMGVVQRPCQGYVACYDYDKCVECLMQHEKMSFTDAVEWMEHNVVSAFMGDHTPVFFHKPEEDEAL